MVVNIVYIAQNIINSRQNCIEFCRVHSLIPHVSNCLGCRAERNLEAYAQYKGIGYCWRCTNRRCGQYRKRISARIGTWFEGSHLAIEKIILITYCFVRRKSNVEAIHESALVDEETSSETICDWFTYCMEACCQIVARNRNRIGGPGLTVEIDEAKFGKRKFNRGRLVDGVWVLGGICRETRESFLVPVLRRDRETLIPIIINHVAPGTTIMTDCWRSYQTLNQQDFNHLTVNHSYNFVDPETGAHTQNIENLWWQIKRKLPETHTTSERFYLYLGEFLWRQTLHTTVEDPFYKFLNDISNL